MIHKEQQYAASIAKLAAKVQQYANEISQAQTVDVYELDALIGKIEQMKELGVIMRYLATNKEMLIEEVLDHYESLLKAQLNQAKQEVIDEPAVKNETPIRVDPKPADEPSETSEDSIEAPVATENELIQEKGTESESAPSPEPVPTPEPEPTKAIEQQVEEAKKQAKSNLKVSLFTSVGASVNDRINLGENSLAEKLRQKPIANLNSALSINQRFLFANELFKGNTDALKNSLNEINHLENLEAAEVFINQYLKDKYNWDLENEIVLEFLQLVERRFIQ